MASILKQAVLPVSPAQAWAALRDVGHAHRMFPGVLVDCRMDGEFRVVTFANGLVVRERIVTIDDESRRFAYAIVRDDLAHHSASMQVIPDAACCRFVWWTDILPDSSAERLEAAMALGVEAIQRRFAIRNSSE